MKDGVGASGLQVLILKMHLPRMLQPNTRLVRSTEKAVFDHDRPELALAEA